MNSRITRRQGLLGLFGGSLGLKAFVTGLPAWYLLNPRRATAQDLQCAITAKANLQYLILSVSSNGDPLNCNVPGTYEATTIIHPAQTSMEQVPVTLGGTDLRRRPALGRPVGHEPDRRGDGRRRAGDRPAHLRRAGADRVLPPPHRHHRPRRPAQGDEAARRHERRRDGRLGLREAPVDLLRHGAGRADLGRRARQLERAGQLRGPHPAVDLADAAQVSC